MLIILQYNDLSCCRLWALCSLHMALIKYQSVRLIIEIDKQFFISLSPHLYNNNSSTLRTTERILVVRLNMLGGVTTKQRTASPNSYPVITPAEIRHILIQPTTDAGRSNLLSAPPKYHRLFYYQRLIK